MRYLIPVIGIIVVSFAFAASPFPPYLEERFKTIEDVTGITEGKNDAQIREGQTVRKVKRAHYDVSVDGGAVGANVDLGVEIPADSLIVNSYYRPTTKFVSASGQYLSVACESSGDLLAATGKLINESTAHIRLGTVTPSSDAGFYTDGCNVVVSIGTTSGSGAYTAGAADFFIEYVETEE